MHKNYFLFLSVCEIRFLVPVYSVKIKLIYFHTVDQSG